jgi:MFS family permease
MIGRFKGTVEQYPGKFWILVGASFIDRLGGNMIFPFFALYVTSRFDVGMTEAGVLFAIFSVSGFFGNMIGGALVDRFGRRSILLFGLVFSALSSLTMGMVESLYAFYLLAVFVGLLSDVAGPAHNAMVADLLPEHQRADGYGILRVAANISWIIGPTVGGFLALRSYMLLFILDAISSLITAWIVYRKIPETMPEKTREGPEEDMLQTIKGYARVAADRLFVAFMLACMLMTVAYLQLYSTLAVYLRDVHGIQDQGYGLLMSINATAVVLFQFAITRRTKAKPPMLLMALGSLLYMVGFSMYGLVSTYTLFVISMLIITFGEMIVLPIGQAIVANLAPQDMRGRYMAFFGLSWTIPAAVGPWAAGLVMDNFDPNWVWYSAGILSALSVAGFLLLHSRTKGRFATTVQGMESNP